MVCTECQSKYCTELRAEMMIHHAKLRDGRADVLLLPAVWVCLDCGFSTFVIPSTELLALKDGHVEDAARASSTNEGG
jgi:hypothetical protein